MQVRHILAIVLACIALHCGTQEDKQAAQTGGEQAVGFVVHVVGTANALGPDGKRPLAVDAKVFASETIETSADSRIQIALHHNGALWELGPLKQVKVKLSAAYRAPPITGQRQSPTLRTAAAGRHSEKHAATPSEMVELNAKDVEQPSAAGGANTSSSAPSVARSAGKGGSRKSGKALGVQPPPPSEPTIETENSATVEESVTPGDLSAKAKRSTAQPETRLESRIESILVACVRKQVQNEKLQGAPKGVLRYSLQFANGKVQKIVIEADATLLPSKRCAETALKTLSSSKNQTISGTKSFP